MHRIMSDSNVGDWRGTNVQLTVDSAHLTEEGGHFKGGSFQMQIICRYYSFLKAAVELRLSVMKEREVERRGFLSWKQHHLI